MIWKLISKILRKKKSNKKDHENVIESKINNGKIYSQIILSDSSLIKWKVFWNKN